MSLKKLFFLFLNVAGISFYAYSQENNIPIGEWRVHLPYNTVLNVDIAGNKIFAGATINGFFYHLDDHSLEPVSTCDILNDIVISKARYHSGLSTLLIGYENGNVDLIKDGNTINISDIKRKNITGSKRINNISFEGNLAYLACDFGLVVLNLQKLEIKETYSNLAPSGLSNRVFGTAFSSDKDSIFIATERGVMAARNNPVVNLMDYSNWFTYGPAQNIPATPILDIANLNGTIYAGINNDGIYYFNGSTWNTSLLPASANMSFLRISQGKLLIGASSTIIIADSESSFTSSSDPSYQYMNDAVLENSGKLWIAHSGLGLLLNNNGALQAISPNSPLTNAAFRLTYFNNNILVTAGAYNGFYGVTYRFGEYNIFNNSSWTSYHIFQPGFPQVLDITSATYSPYDKNIYLTCHGHGLLVHKPNGTYELWDDTVAPFERFTTSPGPAVIITDAKPDKNGNLWVTNSHTLALTEPSLHMRRTDGTWISKSFNLEAARYPMEVLIDNNNYKWIRLRHDLAGGIIVYNDQTNSYKHLTQVEGQGGLPDKAVRAIAMDKNGDIWTGTDQGIGIFYNTYAIFSSSVINASKPLFDGFPLLYNEVVTCIEVDGGNRKWIGTLNGLWLLNEDGTEIIHYFNTENSPILSNVINDVEINEISGEVFIATDKGLISYRGTATEAKEDHSQVKVFPNPVKPEFNGMVGISGLVNEATVKITDIYGTLIYETKSQGGFAVWNVRDYNGRRAAPGVYLIFSSDENGEESFAGKIAVE